MPVVLTDHTNKVWCMEQPDDNYLHAGYVGKGGPRVEDLLEFAESRDKQFRAFLAKKAKGISSGNGNILRSSESRGSSGAGNKEDGTGRKPTAGRSSDDISSPGRTSPSSPS